MLLGDLEDETLGVIENMSYFICDGCDKRHDIFDSGGAEKAAKQLGAPFLGALPLDPATRQGSDNGTPVVLHQPDSPVSQAFADIAGKLAARIAVLAAARENRGEKPAEVVQ